MSACSDVQHELPLGRGRRWAAGWNPFVHAFLGGWRTTLINPARSGFPINITYSPVSAKQACSSCSYRPDVIGPVQDNRYDPGIGFIRANVAIPAGATRPFGTAGRNTGRMEPLYQSDLGVCKSFNLPRECARVEFRSEFFNLLNITNLGSPNSKASAAGFGTVTNAFPARQIQFALKLSY